MKKYTIYIVLLIMIQSVFAGSIIIVNEGDDINGATTTIKTIDKPVPSKAVPPIPITPSLEKNYTINMLYFIIILVLIVIVAFSIWYYFKQRRLRELYLRARIEPKIFKTRTKRKK